ncbi:MAG: hypothetical protein EA392_08275 [Cryomorphaceae bacterium]|nr:MAG: hypothetical protein EA392_08275 [Cryomorphaceae bacterium]
MNTTRKILNFISANSTGKKDHGPFTSEIYVLYQIRFNNVGIAAFSAKLRCDGHSAESSFKNACRNILPEKFGRINLISGDEASSDLLWHLANFRIREVDCFDLLALNEDQTNWFRQAMTFALSHDPKSGLNLPRGSVA